MEIKKRDMMISNTLVGKADKLYFSKVIEDNNFKAVAGIVKWTNVLEKVEVHYNFKDEVIIDNNYTWVEIAPMDNNFWIKAMYDEKDKLIEVYIDITRKNNFDDINNPKYEDLFLDIVIPRKGHIYQMDEVELMKAYTEKLITEEEFYGAKKISKKLVEYITSHHQEFLDYLKNLKLELEYEMENR